MNIEDVYEPIIGEYYLVPCVVKQVIHKKENYPQEELLWLDLDHIPPHLLPTITNIRKCTPVFNHPHNDVENGQHEIHYHMDFRFTGSDPHKLPKGYELTWDARPTSSSNSPTKVEYLPLRLSSYITGATGVRLISKSKLKHDCIYKSKCPHRGYNLSTVPVEDGMITCPLHGLQFDPDTHKLLTKLNEL